MSGVVAPAGSCVVLYVHVMPIHSLVGNTQLPCVDGKLWRARCKHRLDVAQA